MLVQFLTHNLKAALYFLQSQSKYNHDYWPNAIIWPKAMFWPKAIFEVYFHIPAPKLSLTHNPKTAPYFLF